MAHTHHFTSKSLSAMYDVYRPKYPPAMFKYIAEYVQQKLVPPLELAVDVGCGTGISTRPLVEYFDHVIGCDVSESQIEIAKQQSSDDRMTYNGSAQLVLAATAAHWFDPIEDFYREAERVLCPGGTLALCSYSYPLYESIHKNHEELTKAQAKFFMNKDLCDYYQKASPMRNKYRDFTLPPTLMDHIRSEDDFEILWSSHLDEFLQMFRTMSAVQVCHKENSDEPDPVLELQRDLQQYLGDGPLDKTPVSIRFGVFVLLARKPLGAAETD